MLSHTPADNVVRHLPYSNINLHYSNNPNSVAWLSKVHFKLICIPDWSQSRPSRSSEPSSGWWPHRKGFYALRSAHPSDFFSSSFGTSLMIAISCFWAEFWRPLFKTWRERRRYDNYACDRWEALCGTRIRTRISERLRGISLKLSFLDLPALLPPPSRNFHPFIIRQATNYKCDEIFLSAISRTHQLEGESLACIHETFIFPWNFPFSLVFSGKLRKVFVIVYSHAPRMRDLSMIRKQQRL